MRTFITITRTFSGRSLTRTNEIIILDRISPIPCAAAAILVCTQGPWLVLDLDGDRWHGNDGDSAGWKNYGHFTLGLPAPICESPTHHAFTECLEKKKERKKKERKRYPVQIALSLHHPIVSVAFLTEHQPSATLFGQRNGELSIMLIGAVFDFCYS